MGFFFDFLTGGNAKVVAGNFAKFYRMKNNNYAETFKLVIEDMNRKYNLVKNEEAFDFIRSNSVKNLSELGCIYINAFIAPPGVPPHDIIASFQSVLQRHLEAKGVQPGHISGDNRHLTRGVFPFYWTLKIFDRGNLKYSLEGDTLRLILFSLEGLAEKFEIKENYTLELFNNVKKFSTKIDRAKLINPDRHSRSPFEISWADKLDPDYRRNETGRNAVLTEALTGRIFLTKEIRRHAWFEKQEEDPYSVIKLIFKTS